MKKANQARANQQLVNERVARGWSQQEVANRIGTTPVNVSRWERGITAPSSYFRQRLSDLFEKTPQALGLLPLHTTSSLKATDPLAQTASQTDLADDIQIQDLPPSSSEQKKYVVSAYEHEGNPTAEDQPITQFVSKYLRGRSPSLHISPQWRIILVCILILASTTYLLLHFIGIPKPTSTIDPSSTFKSITAGTSSTSKPASTIDTPSAFTSAKVSTDSFSWNHTIGSHNNRLILIEIVTAQPDNTVLSVALDTIPLNRVAVESCPTDCRDEVWYGFDPPVGKHTISVVTAELQPVTATAISLYNVDQSAPFGKLAAINGYETSSAITVPSKKDQLIIDFYSNQATPQFTPVAGYGQTQRVNYGNSSAQEAASSTKRGAPLGTTMTWDWANTNNYADIGIPINSA